jgi:methionyl-tRNA formyltransferase
VTTIIFMGTPDFSVPVLEKIIEDGYEILAVVTQPDRPVGRKKVLTPPPVKAAALKHGLPVLQPEKLSKSAELDEMIRLKPDLVVTAAYGQLDSFCRMYCLKHRSMAVSMYTHLFYQS